MLLEFDADQQLWQDTVRDVITKQCPPSLVRSVAEDGVDPSPLWKSYVDQGWTELNDPASAVELAIVLEELGRATDPTPFLVLEAISYRYPLLLFHEAVTDSECPDVVIVCAVELSTKGHLSPHRIADPVVSNRQARGSHRCPVPRSPPEHRRSGCRYCSPRTTACERRKNRRARGKAVSALQPVAISKNARHQRLSPRMSTGTCRRFQVKSAPKRLKRSEPSRRLNEKPASKRGQEKRAGAKPRLRSGRHADVVGQTQRNIPHS